MLERIWRWTVSKAASIEPVAACKPKWLQVYVAWILVLGVIAQARQVSFYLYNPCEKVANLFNADKPDSQFDTVLGHVTCSEVF